MTNMSPYQINLGTKQIIDKINDNLSWTELSYYKKRIEGELIRMEKFIYTAPVAVQYEIKDELIPLLNNAIEKINSIMQYKKVDENSKHDRLGMSFSDLTDRLDQINRCI